MAMLAARLVELLEPWLGAGPAYVSVASGLRGLVLDGRLPAGSRVPSERALAAALGVSRTTVTTAYDVLRAEGYLRSHRGGGSRVAVPAAVPARPDTDTPSRPGELDLTVAALPAPSALLDAVTRATEALRPMLADHGLHPLGLPTLREAVAAHLTGRGLPTDANQVLITNGALHAWDLLLRVFARPAERVLVEQPTYPAVLDALTAHRLHAVALPVSIDGWEVPAGRTALAHVTPDAQNPTGLLATDLQRRHLMRSLRGTVVAVDETFADLVLDGQVPRPAAGFDPNAITIGSMSKAFWAGLRIGWVRAQADVITRLAQARAAQDLASPVLEQLIAAELLDVADTVLPERRELLRESRDALVAALAHELPTWRCATPVAGMFVWVQLPGLSATRLAARALDLGVRLTPGPRFTIRGTGDQWLRLPFTLPAEQSPAVARLLRQAVESIETSRPTTRQFSQWTA